ncbi:MAG: Bug family tripartite tricarboxylate transporter substrate binding protein [Burkholderiales bacterium]
MTLSPVRGALVCVAAFLSITAWGQQYPTKPVRVVVAFAAGGFADGVARLIGQKMSDGLGQPVVIDNRGGAGGNIATRLVAAAPSDGYTLLVNTAAISINASLYRNPGFDIYKDFVPVALTGSTPGLFAVHASNPASSLQDLIRSAKGRNVTYATAGVGSSSHLAGDYLLRSLAGLNATHVPYQGGAPATAAVLANQVEVLSLSMPPVVPHIKAGRLKGLAISSLKRVPALQDVPTVTEAGFPGFEERSWVGYFAPAKTSAAIVAKLNGEVNKALGMADVRAKLDALGLEPQPVSPGEFATYVRNEVARWAKIVKTTGITAE